MTIVILKLMHILMNIVILVLMLVLVLMLMLILVLMLMLILVLTLCKTLKNISTSLLLMWQDFTKKTSARPLYTHGKKECIK